MYFRLTFINANRDQELTYIKNGVRTIVSNEHCSSRFAFRLAGREFIFSTLLQIAVHESPSMITYKRHLAYGAGFCDMTLARGNE